MKLKCPFCRSVLDVHVDGVRDARKARTIQEFLRTAAVSVRLSHALENCLLANVNQLAMIRDRDLLANVPGLGRGSLAELRRLVPFVDCGSATTRLGAELRQAYQLIEQRRKEAQQQREDADYRRRLASRLREADVREAEQREQDEEREREGQRLQEDAERELRRLTH